MHVSAIICTRNRPDLIGAAVRSVLANTYASFDLLVIDQSDDDRTGTVVQDLTHAHSNLRYIHSTTPGLSKAYNTGIRSTTGAILAFTDDDCVAPPDWIESIVLAFESAQDADMLYGQVLRPAALEDSIEVLPMLEFSEPRQFSRKDGFKIYGMGANFAARRRLFDRVGLFDEVLGGGAPLRSSQDFDLQYRAYRGGATVLLSPAVKVDHYGVRNDEQWPRTLREYGIGEGAFYLKHVRCGDLLAFRLMLWRIGGLLIRDFAKVMVGRRFVWYLPFYFEGLRLSRGYAVDRLRRIYRPT
ncbi:MAG: glycosyltransferase family 2 protein [Chloroflexota bacterium]|nr:glycosyltransferase family 2 protein [Chloroflexota bacterium]